LSKGGQQNAEWFIYLTWYEIVSFPFFDFILKFNLDNKGETTSLLLVSLSTLEKYRV